VADNLIAAKFAIPKESKNLFGSPKSIGFLTAANTISKSCQFHRTIKILLPKGIIIPQKIIFTYKVIVYEAIFPSKNLLAQALLYGIRQTAM